MAAPFKVKDVGEVLGSWPFIPDSSGASFTQAQSALTPQATILGMVREPASGYAVGSKNFYLWRDVAGTPTQTQVSFTAGNKTLAEVISTINTALGATVAENDNGFLRLRSPTVGANSYLRLESIAGSEDVFSVLGLYSETIARGGDYIQAQHIDPSRGVASIGQVGLNVGERLEASAINRSLLQIGINAGAPQSQLSLGRRTRKVRESVTSVGTRGILVGASDPTKGVYLGTTPTPSVEELKNLIRVLDSEGREYQKDVFFSAALTVSNADVELKTGSSSTAKYATITAAGQFGSWDTGLYVVFNSPANGLENKPRRILNSTPDKIIVEADDLLLADTTTTADVELYRGYGGVKVRVDGFYDTFSAPSSFGSRVEAVPVAIGSASGAVSSIERGNRVYLSDPAVNFTTANPGDLVVWANAGSSSPWSNNGSYRIKEIIDEKTITLVNEDYSPAILNPDSTGGYGDISVNSDGLFRSSPYIGIAAQTEANAQNGFGAVPENGETLILEYYVEDNYLEALTNDPNAGGPISSSTESALSSLVQRFNLEHDDFGFSKTIFPKAINMQGESIPGTQFRMTGDLNISALSRLYNEDESVRVKLGQTNFKFGQYAGLQNSTPILTNPGAVIGPTNITSLGGPELWLGFPRASEIGDLPYPNQYPSTKLWLMGDGNRPSNQYVGTNLVRGHSSVLYMGYRRESEGVANQNTLWSLSTLGDGTDAIMKLAFLGLNESDGFGNGVSAVDNQMVFHSSGGVGVNLGDLTPAGGTVNKAGVPDANLHIRARSDTDTDLLRLEGFSGASTASLVTFKPKLDEGFYGRMGLEEDGGDWFMSFALSTEAQAASSVSEGFKWIRNVNGSPIEAMSLDSQRLTLNTSITTGTVDGLIRTSLPLDPASRGFIRFLTSYGTIGGVDTVPFDFALGRNNPADEETAVFDASINVRDASENNFFRLNNNYNSVSMRLEPAVSQNGGEVFSILWRSRSRSASWGQTVDPASGWTKAFSIKAKETYVEQVDPLSFLNFDGNWVRDLPTGPGTPTTGAGATVNWTKPSGSAGDLYIPIRIPDGVTLTGVSVTAGNFGTGNFTGIIVKRTGTTVAVLPASPQADLSGFLTIDGLTEVVDNETSSYYLKVHAPSSNNITVFTEATVSYRW